MAITVSELQRFVTEKNDFGSQMKEALSRLCVFGPDFQGILEEHNRMARSIRDAFARIDYGQSLAESIVGQTGDIMRQQAERCLEATLAFQDAESFWVLNDFRFSFSQLNSVLFDFQRISDFEGMHAEIMSMIRGQLDRVLEFQSAFSTAFESYEGIETTFAVPRQLSAPLLPIKPQPNSIGASDCLVRLGNHIAEAEQKAQETGGYVLVLCKTPEGEVLKRYRLEALDPYFISVTGIGLDGEEHDFVIHFSELHISISVRDKDAFEEEPPSPTTIN